MALSGSQPTRMGARRREQPREILVLADGGTPSEALDAGIHVWCLEISEGIQEERKGMTGMAVGARCLGISMFGFVCSR